MPDGLSKVLYFFRAIIIAVLGVIILFNLYGIYMQVIFNSDYPTIFGITRYISKSDYPDLEISENDYLITIDFLGYDQGDVIIYEDSDKNLIVDKIAKKNDDSIYLVSDVKKPMNSDLIIRGKIVYNQKGLGEYMSMLESPAGIIIMVLIVVLVYEIPKLFSGINSKKSVREKRF